MSAIIIPFASTRKHRERSTVVSHDTVNACIQLLNLAETGDLSGFAIVGVQGHGSGKYWFDTVGLSAKDADGCIPCLGRLLHRLDGLSDGAGLAS